MFCQAQFEQLLYSYCVTLNTDHTFFLCLGELSANPVWIRVSHVILRSLNVMKYLWRSLQCDVVFGFAFARVTSSRTSSFFLSILLTFLMHTSEFPSLSCSGRVLSVHIPTISCFFCSSTYGPIEIQIQLPSFSFFCSFFFLAQFPLLIIRYIVAWGFITERQGDSTTIHLN